MRARAAFLRRGGTRNWLRSTWEAISNWRVDISGPFIFSEVFLARTRQEVLPGHFESDMTERGY